MFRLPLSNSRPSFTRKFYKNSQKMSTWMSNTENHSNILYFHLYHDLFRLWVPKGCVLFIVWIKTSPRTRKNSKRFSQKLQITVRRSDWNQPPDWASVRSWVSFVRRKWFWCFVGPVCISAVRRGFSSFCRKWSWRPICYFYL
jgi:hypothetical protein